MQETFVVSSHRVNIACMPFSLNRAGEFRRLWTTRPSSHSSKWKGSWSKDVRRGVAGGLIGCGWTHAGKRLQLPPVQNGTHEHCSTASNETAPATQARVQGVERTTVSTVWSFSRKAIQLYGVVLRIGYLRTKTTHTDNCQYWLRTPGSDRLLFSNSLCFQLNVSFLQLSLTLPRVIWYQTSSSASPEILHHTVWRTWLFIAHSDERWSFH